MMASGAQVYAEPFEAEGFLFIGDPHVSSIRPFRRTEPDWPTPIFRKLEAAVKAANERYLVPVFLGDMFDVPVEPDEAVKTRLTLILKRFWMTPVTNVGNHDMANTTLSFGDSLAYLAASDVVDAVVTSGPALVLRIGAKLVGLGMTPYGQDIPRDVRGVFNDPQPDVVVWATHHDVAFAGAYSGAALPFEIAGCDVVVNGHMHKTLPTLRQGRTRWFNQGNITRLTSDVMDHVPYVWAFARGGAFEPVDLPYGRGVFDMTGKFVEPIAPLGATPEAVADADSAFVSLLEVEDATELARSQDGSGVMEQITGKFDADDTPDAVRDAVTSLWKEAVARRSG